MATDNRFALADSVTAASGFPSKLVAFYASSDASHFAPIHPQFYVSNACQLKCRFCSCKHRKQEVPYMTAEVFRNAILSLRRAGSKAITFSGGGEPLLCPDLIEMMDLAHRGLYMDLGLVTNGIALDDMPSATLQELSWLRVSLDESRIKLPPYLLREPGTQPILPAASYVWQTLPPPYLARHILSDLIDLAQKGRLHHLRIVSDILDDTAGESLSLQINGSFLGANVILQPRNHHEVGNPRCWMPLIKPVIDVDGRVYTCCGAQYALKDASKQRTLPKELCIAENVDEYLHTWVDAQRPFNGSICAKCYYGNYNRALNALKAGVTGNGMEYANFL